MRIESKGLDWFYAVKCGFRVSSLEDLAIVQNSFDECSSNTLNDRHDRGFFEVQYQKGIGSSSGEGWP